MENHRYFDYDDVGRITTTYDITEDVFLALTERGVRLIRGDVDPQRHYIVNGEITVRPVLDVTLQDNVLLNVPVGAKVYVNGVAYLAEDSRIELEFDQPGQYRISVECWPYLSKEFTIENQTQ